MDSVAECMHGQHWDGKCRDFEVMRTHAARNSLSHHHPVGHIQIMDNEKQQPNSLGC